jgi:poly(3-hydroxybutyrate) depolymerase
MGDTHLATRHRRVVVAGVLLTALLSVAACASHLRPGRGGSDTATATATGRHDTVSTGRYTSHSTIIDGIERTWNVYTPARETAGGVPMPVVLVIHGTGDTGDGIRAGIGPDLEDLAERDGIPTGSPPSPVRDGDAEITTWDGDHPVRLIAVDHSGHSFPTASGRWGNDGGARVDGPGAIWEFFRDAKPLSGTVRL